MRHRAGQAIVVGLAAASLCYLYGLGFSWRIVVTASLFEWLRSEAQTRFKDGRGRFDARVTPLHTLKGQKRHASSSPERSSAGMSTDDFGATGNQEMT